MQSASELESAASAYKQQLEQVKAQLLEEPNNAEFLQLHADLVEVVNLTEELLDTAPQVLEAALEEEHQNSTTSDHMAEEGVSDLRNAPVNDAPIIGPSLPTNAERNQQTPPYPDDVMGLKQPVIGASLPTHIDKKKQTPLRSDNEPKYNQQRHSLEPDGREAESEAIVKAQDLARSGRQERHTALGKRKQMHPRNKYAEAPPDFDELAAKYPSFAPYVYHSAGGRPNIEWTDFNASRELTKVLLDHNHGISWWIPDGQLCSTVTNRANYIHWIEDLLYLSPAPWQGGQAKTSPTRPVAGLDIGVGANCIYPLLGASLNGWKFVGTDVTPVALTWAQKNVEANPHLKRLIEIRSVAINTDVESNTGQSPRAGVNERLGSEHAPSDRATEIAHGAENAEIRDGGPSNASPSEKHDTETGAGQENIATEAPHSRDERSNSQHGSAELSATKHPILDGALQPGESFDFCMCNPPFFESMDEASANPRTACGGTEAEMVFPGGEEAFVGRMIEDSCRLKGRVHWYTSMVGKKASLKKLTALLRQKRVAATETTEFVQGKTSRWGLAWSFTPRKMTAAMKEAVAKKLPQRTKISFTLQRLGRQTAAWTVLQAIREELEKEGATCQVNEATFALQASIPAGCLSISSESAGGGFEELEGPDGKRRKLEGEELDHGQFDVKVSVFQQAPGTLLVSAILTGQRHPVSTTAAFGTLFDRVEEKLRKSLMSA